MIVIVGGFIEVLVLPLPVLLDDIHWRQVVNHSLTSRRFFEVPKTHVMNKHLEGICAEHPIH